MPWVSPTVIQIQSLQDYFLTIELFGVDSLLIILNKHIHHNRDSCVHLPCEEKANDRLYGHISHPIEIKQKGQKIAVRMISLFGEESTKVISI